MAEEAFTSLAGLLRLSIPQPLKSVSKKNIPVQWLQEMNQSTLQWQTRPVVQHKWHHFSCIHPQLSRKANGVH